MRASWSFGLLLLTACGDTPVSPPDAGGATGDPPALAFAARFEDATAASGVDFVHHTGGFGEKWLPETMGAGACLFDADGDDVLDLFLVDSGAWPAGAARPELPPPGVCRLFRGRGDGTFEDVTDRTGTGLAVYGMGVIAADHDGDGDEDLYVTTLEDDLLLQNDGGVFRDVAARAGVGRGRWNEADGPRPEWTTAALWFDADRDDHLDLFVGGYVRWTPEREIFTSLDGVTKAFTTPERYTGLPSRLYLGNGDGTYEEVPLGVGSEAGKVLGATLWDFDGDGALEVAAANDTRPNFLFANRGGGRFEEIGEQAGLAYDPNGRARAGMGIDVAEPGGASAMVAIGNFAGEPLSLYERLPDGGFRHRAAHSGLQVPTSLPLTFGLAFLDIDLDGWLDLVVVNGHIEPEIARLRSGESHAQGALLFRGRPDGRFEDVTASAGADFARPRVGRGLAWGDLDGDGDLDLVLTQNGASAVVLLNRLQDEAPRHWLRIALRQPGGNRAAIGARIELESGGRLQVRTVRTGSSYLSQGELTVTFGLGELDVVEVVRVRWPDGTRSEHAVEAVDRTLVLSRP